MKKFYLTLKLLVVAGFLSIPASSFAQTYSAWGVTLSGANYDTIDIEEDTLRFQFNSIPPGAYGMAKIVIYYEADLGDFGETLTPFTATNSVGTNLQTFPSFGQFGTDCLPEDSIEFTFPSAVIVSNGNTIGVKIYPSFDVNTFCANNRAKVRLQVEICPFGTPVAYAHASSIDGTVCPYETTNLTGTPAGGTFTGPGVSGSTFNPASLSAGVYTITYTATDGIGCVTSDDTTITVLPFPQIPDYIVCYNDTATVVPANSAQYIYYNDIGLTSVIDTANKLDYGPLFADESIFAVNGEASVHFNISSLTGSSAVTVDQYPLMNDDRGGIAITPDFVYVVGDDYTVRHDISLAPGSGIQLPQRDGIFSDLYSGRLYTLYNVGAASDPVMAPGTFTVDALMEMDDMLNFTGTMVNLTMPITLDYDSKIFAGAGIVILHSYADDHFYVVNINTGDVNDLGASPATFNMFSTENWLDWGIAEFDGGDYSIVYRDDFGDFISRMNLTTGAITTVASFSDLADMASITYSRWENKWYWKYEYAGEFGGSDEICGKLDATGTMVMVPAGGGCYTEIEFTVPAISLGADQFFCQGDEADFAVGLGYSSITWNGDNNNQNAYSVTTGGTVTIEAVEASTGCLVVDSAVAIMNPLPTVTFNLTDDHACTSQTAFPLTGGTPAGGIYSGSFVSGTNFNASSAGNGTHIVTYTYIDANGCLNYAQDAVFVDGCVGVDELGSELLSIYPNPANSMIVINAGSFVSQPVSIDIYDAQGKVVYTEKTTLVNNHEVNVSSLENGVYQVILSVEGSRSIAKLVIQK